jgi:hypothetical protein
MFKKHHIFLSAFLALPFLLLFSAQIQDSIQVDSRVTITYEPTDEIFPNPERGFYQWVAATPTSPLLNVSTLREYRAENRTLVFRPYLISDFRDSDISEKFLNKMRSDFETLREAGMKTLFQFRYANSRGDDDAPLERVLHHLDQLAPLFQEYYDVIALSKGGFIGAWGEWHSSTHGLTTTANMRTILFHFLNVLPKERMIAIRRPVYIWNIYNLGLYGDPLTEEEAHSGSNRARTGHHNDSFMTNETNAGTYFGLDTMGENTFRLDIEAAKDFLNLNNRYVPMGGETGAIHPDTPIEFYSCENSLKELSRMRWDLLNHGFNRDILDVWVDQGCMPEVERRLGYRFVLTEGSYSEQARAGGALQFNLEIKNEGFGAPFNPRGLQVILRSPDDPKDIWEVNLPDDPRFWIGGETVNLSREIGLPKEMKGYYEVLLNLPDPAKPILHQPEFSIRLANDGIWEEETGFNRLNHFIRIDPTLPGDDYDGDLIFVPFGTWQGEPVTTEQEPERGVDIPATTHLHQNYPNPFNPSTTIIFDLQQNVHVRLEVFNLLGQKVANLVDQPRAAGTHHVSFDSNDLSSGVYLYTLTAGNITETRSMTVIR